MGKFMGWDRVCHEMESADEGGHVATHTDRIFKNIFNFLSIIF